MPILPRPFSRFFFDEAGHPKFAAAQEVVPFVLCGVAIPEDQRLVILEFQDMVKLPDGRIAAIVVGDNLADDATPAGPTLFYLTEQDGHWYIDDYVNA